MHPEQLPIYLMVTVADSFTTGRKKTNFDFFCNSDTNPK